MICYKKYGNGEKRYMEFDFNKQFLVCYKFKIVC